MVVGVQVSLPAPSPKQSEDAVPYSVGEKLRVQFRKDLRKGHVQNAQLDPTPSGIVSQIAEDGEVFIVKVDRSKGGQLWFSDLRVLLEHEGIHELFRL
jgi:hypothetical protein